MRLGAGTDTPAAMLAALAGDSAVTVRAAVALNHAAPGPINCLLALDGDERIRLLLARKTAQLAPDLAGIEREGLHERIAAALAILVGDEVVRVRAAIAEIVKTMPDAPRQMILRLAHDTAVSVSEPIIRLSPLLTSEDLLALLAAPPHAMVATAVACRANLPQAVSDAVAATADTAAIRALLSNETAAIREATLDALVAGAACRAEWHAPLVRRPALSARSALALSGIIVSELLAVLAARTDFDPAVTETLRRQLAERLAPARPPVPSAACAVDAARRLDRAGGLSEAAMLAAADQGDEAALAAMLAVASGLPIATVDRAVALRSAKGIVSLVWRAGFTMRVAESLQSSLAGLDPAGTLVAGPGGTFPLAVEEMLWQLQLLGRARC